MEYVRLGSSGLRVSKIILGCMSYGNPDWYSWVLPEQEGIAHIKAAYDAGINTFDTANAYSHGESEIILGKAIKQHNFVREKIVVMTKIYCAVSPDTANAQISHLSGDALDKLGYVNQHGLSRKHIFDAVKASLQRLQLDYIDVLQCHRFDYDTPVEETMHALHDVVQAGFVRYLGMSSCHAYQFHIMQNYATQHNLTPFISMQNHYSLLYREEEREMYPTLKHFGVTSIPWSPLARGKLARPLAEQKVTKRAGADRMINGYGSQDEVISRVEELATKKGLKMAQVALAWILSKESVSAPIVGTTSIENMMEAIDAIQVKLSEEEVRYLEEPYTPQPVYGHT
ncbi:Aldo/keto reductase [Hymenopellis radicata]|nr:Aldo/keto reductase [Hymenopellis radicata]